ncbi:MAG TPA: HAD-IA family hydrolase [Candidatus Acidoferrales bacterium]|nr:HAD-IA family hydrolase [Candidatus Acidoferrales bacterium]
MLKAPKSEAHAYELIIFDVDGVLVDVRESYQRTVLETILRITGKRVSRKELHEWKNRPGFNDDWKLTHAWARELGSKLDYAAVKKHFEAIYWGDHNGSGNVSRERWQLSHSQIRRLANRAELAIFTGRTRDELDHTLERFDVRKFFSRIVTVEDVTRPKPEPDGLMQILDGRLASLALYAGDNVDDAAAARTAGVAFVGVLPARSEERRIRAARLLELGAKTIFSKAGEIEKWIDLRPHA